MSVFGNQIFIEEIRKDSYAQTLIQYNCVLVRSNDYDIDTHVGDTM